MKLSAVRENETASLIQRITCAIPTIGSVSLSELEAITSTPGSHLETTLDLAIDSGLLCRDPNNGENIHTASSLTYTSSGSALLEIFGYSNKDDIPDNEPNFDRLGLRRSQRISSALSEREAKHAEGQLIPVRFRGKWYEQRV